jgi:hypothetical protein
VGTVRAIVAAVADPLPGYCYIRAGDLSGLPWELYALSLRPLPIHPCPPLPWELYALSLRPLPIHSLSSSPVGIVRAIVAAIADSPPCPLPCKLYALLLRPLPVHPLCVRLARVIVRVIVAAVAVSLHVDTLICHRGAPVPPKVCAIPNQNAFPRLFSSFNLLPPLSLLSFPRLSPLPTPPQLRCSLHRTHPVRCRISASCSRPTARRLPARRRHASRSPSVHCRQHLCLPQPRRLEPFLPTPPCSLSSIPSPLPLSSSSRHLPPLGTSPPRRLSSHRRSPLSHCTPVDCRRPDSHQRQQRKGPRSSPGARAHEERRARLTRWEQAKLASALQIGITRE